MGWVGKNKAGCRVQSPPYKKPNNSDGQVSRGHVYLCSVAVEGPQHSNGQCGLSAEYRQFPRIPADNQTLKGIPSPVSAALKPAESQLLSKQSQDSNKTSFP